MRREYNDPFRERLGRNRPCTVVCVRFAAGPARDGMLQVIEHIDIDLVIRTFLLKQLAERILDIILVLELEYRLMDRLAQPYYSLAYKLRSPFARSDKPRGDYP